jgi:hypothetical protein
MKVVVAWKEVPFRLWLEQADKLFLNGNDQGSFAKGHPEHPAR